MRNLYNPVDEDVEVVNESLSSDNELDFWLMENMKIMEQLTIQEPSSWSERVGVDKFPEWIYIF